MIHIVRAMINNGPLVHYWSMSYQSKHKNLKACALTSCNKIDLLETVFMKMRLRLEKLILNKKPVKNELLYNYCEEIDTRKKMYFSTIVNLYKSCTV